MDTNDYLVIYTKAYIFLFLFDFLRKIGYKFLVFQTADAERKFMKRYIIAVTLILATVSARAELFSFDAITSTDPFNPAIGESQLFMDVRETDGAVSITFTNTGPQLSTIAEIYFDSPDVEPPLNLTLDQIINTPGVNFIEGARPPELPSGRLFEFCADLASEATNPAQTGIDPNEYLVLEMSYTHPPYSFIDLLKTGELRVGLHVVSMGTSAGSESFINNIPEPSTALLLGFVALVGRSYRRIFVV